MNPPRWKPIWIAALISCLVHAGLLFFPSNRTVSSGQYAAPVRFTLTTKLPGERQKSPTATEAIKPHATNQTNSAQHPDIEAAYYTTDQLSKHPQALGEPQLEIEDASEYQGTVALKIWISASGEVVSVQIEESDLPANVTDAAVDAFRHLRFAAGELYGRPVGSVMEIEVAYGNHLPASPDR